MTEFPELQRALVDAARSRYGGAPRTRRLVGPVLAAAACAAAVAAVLLLTGSPDEDALAEAYAVFSRPATEDDALPDADSFANAFLLEGDRRGFDSGRTRLVAQEGDSRVYLVSTPLEGRPAVCIAVYVRAEARRGGCVASEDVPAEEVQEFTSGPSEGLPGMLVAAVRDGVDEVRLTMVDGSTRRLPVRDNAVYAELDRTPASIAWESPDGSRSSRSVRGTGS